MESSFGSYHLVDGFILNNQLSDFSAEPHATDGSPVANRVEPGKRPRSSMAPTLVFDHSSAGRGALYAVLGSPGGSMIIQFVVKTLVAMLDWGLNPQQAVSLVDFGAANSPHTNLGGENPEINTSDDGDHDPLVQGLRALGHRVNLAEQSSGLGDHPQRGGLGRRRRPTPRRRGHGRRCLSRSPAGGQTNADHFEPIILPALSGFVCGFTGSVHSRASR